MIRNIKDVFSFAGLDQNWYLAAIVIFYFLFYGYKYFSFRRFYNINALKNLTDYSEKPKGLQDKIVKELLLQNCFGRVVSVKEYEFFNSIPNSLNNLRSYLSCKEYVLYDESKNCLVLKKGKLKIKAIFWFFLYVFFVVITSFLLMNSFFGDDEMNFGVVMYVIAFFMLSMLSLNQSLMAKTASNLYLKVEKKSNRL
jgi:hypothetical protein